MGDSCQPASENILPLKFEYLKCLTTHSHINLLNYHINAIIDDTFTLFESIKNEFLLIYSYTEDFKVYSLFCYNIKNRQNVAKIAKAHNYRIYTGRHFLEQNSNNDLLLTGSFDKYIKIWNLTNQYTLVCKIKPDYDYKVNTYLLSENLLFYNNNNYIITSAYEIGSQGYEILIYNLNNLKNFEKFENSKDNTNYLGVYYDYAKKKTYVTSGNLGNIKIFDFSNKKLIYKFDDNNVNTNYISIIIKDNQKREKQVIASSFDGYLRIWEFNNFNKMAYKIKGWEIEGDARYLNGLCLLNDQYILGASCEGKIKIFDLNANHMIYSFQSKYNDNDFVMHDQLLSIKTIDIQNKKYLISHSEKGLIELWEYQIKI